MIRTHLSPTGDAVAAHFASLGKELAFATSLSENRLGLVRDLLPQDSSIQCGRFSDLISAALSLLNSPGMRVPHRGQIQASIEISGPDEMDSALSWTQLRGLHVALGEAQAELHRWGVSPADLRQCESPRMDQLAGIYERAETHLNAVNREFLFERLLWILSQEPVCLGHLGRIIVLGAEEPYPLQEKFLQWLVDGKTDVEILIEDYSMQGDAWWTGLFTAKVVTEPPIQANIVRAPDVLSEVEWALRGCQEKISNGALPHQIAIFAPSSEEYSPLLKHCADNLGLILSWSPKAELLSNAFASLVLDTLEALVSDDVRDFLRIAQSSYWCLTDADVAELQAEVKEARKLRAGSQARMAEWSKGDNPAQKWLAQLLGWKEEFSQRALSIPAWSVALKQLLALEPLPLAVTDDSWPTSERDLRAVATLTNCLRDYGSILESARSEVQSLREFIRLCRKIWSDELTVLPGSNPSGIPVFSQTDLLRTYDHLFVLGMLEGIMPRRRREDPVLFDSDRAEISQKLNLDPPLLSSHDVAANQRHHFIRLVANTRQTLTLSYPAAGDNRDNVPAFYLHELNRLLGGSVVRTHHRRRQLVPEPSACRAGADLRLAKALAEPVLENAPALLTTEDALAKIRLKPEEAVSIRELVRAMDCTFRSSLQYRLGVEQGGQRDPRLRLYRIPRKANIAQATDTEAVKSALDAAAQDELLDLYGDLEPWEYRIWELAAKRLCEQWLNKETKARAELPSETAETKTYNPDANRIELKIPVDGVSQPVFDLISDLVWATVGYSKFKIVRTFDLSNLPREMRLEDNDWIRLAFLGLASGSPLSMVEVDGPAVTRSYAKIDAIQDRQAIRPAFPQHRIGTVLDVGQKVFGDRGDLAGEWREAVRKAVRRVIGSTMMAEPGQYCDSCAYGELCRVSSQFGEVVESQ